MSTIVYGPQLKELVLEELSDSEYVSYPSPKGEGLSAALSRSVSESEICPRRIGKSMYERY